MTDTQREYCDRCDGCGWYEGGATLQTNCEKCGGTGVVEVMPAPEYFKQLRARIITNHEAPPK